MVLANRRWGAAAAECVVCVHGITQHGGIFARLGEDLAARGRAVVALDLRGHGDSERLPPWDTETHVADLIETLDALGIERVTWVGHSLGGRLVAAAAALRPERARGLALLDPAVEVPAEASSCQQRGNRCHALVLSVSGIARRLRVVGMEAEDVVGHPLRFSRGVKNLAAILLEHGDPGLEVARVIGNVQGNPIMDPTATEVSSARSSSFA